MSNSQHLFPTPNGRKQSSDYGPYKFEQIHTARKSLKQRVCNSRIQWLCSTMRFNSFGNDRMTTSNLWEGDSGMMEHVQIPFPMPTCQCLQSHSPEKSISESFVKDPPSWDISDNYHRSYEDFSEQQSEISNSLNINKLFRGVESSGALKSDCTYDNGTTAKSKTDGHVGTKTKKLKLIRKITEINNNVNHTHKKLSAEETSLSNSYLKVRKKACQKLADLHRVTLMYQDQLEIAKIKVGRCGYEKPAIFAIGSTRRLKKHHNLQDELVSILSNTLTNFDSLRSRFKDILCDNAKFIEPHRSILNKAISDLLEGPCKDDELLLHKIPENDCEGSTLHLEKSLQTETSLPEENKKCNDNSRISNSRDCPWQVMQQTALMGH